MTIILISVQSVNGFITRGEEAGTRFASREDGEWFRKTLCGMDLVLLGGQTYRAARDSVRKGALKGPPRWVITRNPDALSGDQLAGKLEFMTLDERRLLKRIEEGGFHQVALVGGPGIASWFLDHGLVSDLYLTIEPCLFPSGKPLAAPANIIDLELQKATHLSPQTLLLHYHVKTGL